MKRLQWAMVPLVGVTLLASVSAQQQSIAVEFTAIPVAGAGSDSRGDIAGRVRGLDKPDSYKMVIYAHTDQWYVQPLVSDPFTDVTAEGQWGNWTHLGHRYAVLVVRPSFKPSAKLQTLPGAGGDVLAKFETEAKGGD